MIALLLLLFGMVILMRFVPTEYCLTENFIRWNVGNSTRFVHWRAVEQATLRATPVSQ